MISLIGVKVGMTHIYDMRYHFVPVTIIKVYKNIITQIKNVVNDGYQATQIMLDLPNVNKMSHRVSLKNIYKKKKCKLWEIYYNKILHQYVGQKIDVSVLKDIKKIDIIGITKGKGYAGTVKKWHFAMQDKTHGNSLSHRVPGSIGQNQTPGRVYKGKKMSGRMGGVKRTILSLSLLEVNIPKDFIVVKGSVPGNKGHYVYIRTSIRDFKKEL